MKDNVIRLIDALFAFEAGLLAQLVDDRKLLAYDRFDRFDVAPDEERDKARDAITAHVTAMSGADPGGYVARLELARGFPDSILTTSGFAGDDLLKARNATGDGSLKAEVLALKGAARDAKILQLFRTLGGRRKGEMIAGTRGAHTALVKLLGMDSKGLARALDRALLAETRAVRMSSSRH